MNVNKDQYNKLLSKDNANKDGIDQKWDKDNQAWWDWYVTLAVNSDQSLKKSLVDLPHPPKTKIPTDKELESELCSPFMITKTHISNFKKNGFIKIPNVLSPETLARLRVEIVKLLNKKFKYNIKKKYPRFLSLEMMWVENSIIRKYVLSSRIAKICADLLEVKSVRLYHDNALAKEPGCGRTPWHCDDTHFPLATNKVITAWIPAQAIPTEMGPLAFAKPLNVYKLVKDIKFNKFNTSYDEQIIESFRSNKVSIEEGPFNLGEISFHHNLCYHTAARNNTSTTRIVLANTFFADGARVVDKPTMISGDWQKFIPATLPGEIVSSKLNPVCWPLIEKK